jgi:hypothetical protein
VARRVADDTGAEDAGAPRNIHNGKRTVAGRQLGQGGCRSLSAAMKAFVISAPRVSRAGGNGLWPSGMTQMRDRVAEVVFDARAADRDKQGHGVHAGAFRYRMQPQGVVCVTLAALSRRSGGDR